MAPRASRFWRKVLARWSCSCLPSPGAEDFDEVAALLAAAGFRVLRPEPRGIGPSTGPMEGITLYDLAENVAAAVQAAAADDRPYVVAGHAFGNWVARALSALRPDRVRAVVLLAASIGPEIDPAIRPSINGSFDPAGRGAPEPPPSRLLRPRQRRPRLARRLASGSGADAAGRHRRDARPHLATRRGPRAGPQRRGGRTRSRRPPRSGDCGTSSGRG
jgi:pimeloyl-ACP methyl ester carboxylesterase